MEKSFFPLATTATPNVTTDLPIEEDSLHLSSSNNASALQPVPPPSVATPSNAIATAPNAWEFLATYLTADIWGPAVWIFVGGVVVIGVLIVLHLYCRKMGFECRKEPKSSRKTQSHFYDVELDDLGGEGPIIKKRSRGTQSGGSQRVEAEVHRPNKRPAPSTPLVIETVKRHLDMAQELLDLTVAPPIENSSTIALTKPKTAAPAAPILKKAPTSPPTLTAPTPSFLGAKPKRNVSFEEALHQIQKDSTAALEKIPEEAAALPPPPPPPPPAGATGIVNENIYVEADP